ncbi:hypothetical protein WJX82_004841 [Trebouxia sp. C0006]
MVYGVPDLHLLLYLRQVASMNKITFQIRQGQMDLTVVQYESPLSAAQAKRALLEENPTWIGALQEEGSSTQMGGDQQLKPGFSYTLVLQHQPDTADSLSD